MRRRIQLTLVILLSYLGVLILIGGTLFIRYRLPYGDPITIEGEIYHHIIIAEFDVRSHFESFCGNRSALLIEDGGGRVSFWIDRNEYSALVLPLWKEDKGYTYRLTVEMRPLYFGGYGIGRIIDCEKIPGSLKIFK